MPTIRASRTPLLFNCSASRNAPDVVIEQPMMVRNEGLAVHEALEKFVSTHEIPDLGIIAERHGVDIDTLSKLFYVGKRAWERIKPGLAEYWPERQMAAAFEGIILSGRSDVVGFTPHPQELTVIDWKAGYAEVDNSHQNMTYLYLARKEDAPLQFDSYKHITVWLRSQSIDIVSVTDDDLNAWADKLKDILNGPEVYSPGTHCIYCPMQYECKAKSKYTQTAINDLVARDDNLPETVQELANMYPKIQMISKAIDRYKDALKIAVLEHGEGIKLEDGRTLSLEEQSRETVLPEYAWQYLAEYFGYPSDPFNNKDFTVPDFIKFLGDSVSISKSKLLKLVSNKTKRGMKGKEQKRIMELLRENDSVNTKTFDKIVLLKGESDEGI